MTKSRFRQRLDGWLKDTASAIAAGSIYGPGNSPKFQLPYLPGGRTVHTTVTSQIAKGKPYGRYIKHESYLTPSGEHRGPIEGRKLVIKHAFLHATKGWRVFSDVPLALIAAIKQGRVAQEARSVA